MKALNLSFLGKFARVFLRSACLLPLAALTLAAYEGPVPQPTDAYGALGPYQVQSAAFWNPNWPNQAVTVYYPGGVSGKRPTWFFCHGFGGSDPENYREIMRHLASHGSVAVYSSYPAIAGGDPGTVYSILYDGFMAASRFFPELIDTTRVGFAGHSYGGGAVPAIALRAIWDEGWGANGVALFIMAPWYSYFVDDQDLASFPLNTKAVVQIYDADTINDHRMAIDLFRHLDIEPSNKEFLMVRSDRVGDYNYEASHRVPTGEGSPDGRSEFNALDSWAVHRQMQALGAAVWDGDAAAAAIALGNGSPSQLAMGKTESGRALRTMVWSDSPTPLYAPERYTFRYDDPLNPRRNEPVPGVAKGAYLRALSARAKTFEGDGTLIVGATISGAFPKTLLVRADGPLLGGLGMPGALPDPVFRLFSTSGLDTELDDWEQGPNPGLLAEVGAELGMVPLTTGSHDAGLLVSVDPGSLTTHVAAKPGQSGVALLEFYDAEQNGPSSLLNLSARSRVGGGDDILIAGFVVEGGDLRLLLRGLGPALGKSGFVGALGDTVLSVYRDGALIAENDDWSSDPVQADAVESAVREAGTSQLERGSRDSSLVLKLSPGAYTVQLSGKAGSEGVGIVELLSLPANQ